VKWILLDVICMEVLLHGDLGTLHGSSLSGKAYQARLQARYLYNDLLFDVYSDYMHVVN
jgi:hypothetical protein